MLRYKVTSLLFCVLMALTNTAAQSGWQLQTNPLGTGEEAMLGRVEFVSPTEGWISGSRGTLLHTTDAGENWIVVNPWPSDTLWSGSDPGYVMDWVGPTHGWKLDNMGDSYGTSTKALLHKTTDGGVTWSRKVLSEEAGDFGFKVQFYDHFKGWILIWNFTTMTPKFLKTTDGGENWVPFNGMGIFFFKSANVGWCYNAEGPNMTPPFKIYKTTDGGTNWTEQFSDSQPGMYDDIFFIDHYNGWIVGDNGKVLKTSDGGTTWITVPYPGINPFKRSRTIFFLDNNNGWIPSKMNDETPYIQHTTDGGQSWTTQEVPIGGMGYNAIYSIFFTDINSGYLTADWGRICRFTGTTAVGEENSGVEDFRLYQNYPNPFNPSTKIMYSIPVSEFVSIKVYDVLGNEIANLVNEEKASGTYELEFNASAIPSGVYFCQLKAGSYSAVKKLTLIK